MRRFAIATTLLVALFATGAAVASGPTVRGASAEPDESLTVTTTINCVVIEIHEDGTVVVEDKDGTHRLPYTEKTRFTAAKKKQFGKRKLAVADLREGQELRVVYQPATGEVLSVKVSKPG